MFDRISIDYERTKYVPYCKEVREIKAPTDESVKLLIDIEEKVTRKILDKFVCNDNIVNFKAFLYEIAVGLGYEWKYSVSINGKEYLGSHKTSTSELYKSRSEITYEVRKMFIEEIVKEMLKAREA